MKKLSLALSVGVFALLSAPLAAHAESHTHDGFYLRLAGGLNYVSDSATATAGGASSSIGIKGVGGSFDLGLGGAVAPGIIIGGLLQGAVVSSPKVTVGNLSFSSSGSLNVSSIGPFIDYYLDPHAGLHLVGMVGFTTISVQDTNGNSSTNNPKGLTLSAGFGDEWWVSDEWSIGVMGRLQYVNATYSDGPYEEKHSVLIPAVLATFTYN